MISCGPFQDCKYFRTVKRLYLTWVGDLEILPFKNTKF